jgi:hypothetical protein
MGSLLRPEGDIAALIVPVHQLLGATMTATSQAGPRPGGFTRTSSATTALALVSSGTLDQAIDPIDVVTLEAGHLGRTTARWRYDGENLRSWDPPAVVSGWECVDRTTTANRWIRPHVVRRPSTGLLVVSATYDLNTVAVVVQNRFGKWLSSTVEDTGNNTVSTIVPLQSGRLVDLYVYQTSASTSQIRMSFSDDGGGTWALGSSACLTTDLAMASTAYKRIRAVELNGLISVCLWQQDASTDTLFQYVSSDDGATLDLVETTSTADAACPDMATAGGVIYLATVEHDAGALDVVVRTLSSASMPFSSVAGVNANEGTGATWGVLTGTIITTAECAILADDDGAVWVYGVECTGTTRETIKRRSGDGGVTWDADNLGYIYEGDTTTYLRDITVAPERGRAVLVHRTVADTSADDSLCATYLGGWSSVGMPQDRPHRGWQGAWLGFEKPEDTSATWTAALTGAATATLGSAGLTLAATGADDALYTAAPDTSTALADGLLVEFHVTVASGTAVQDVRITDLAGNSYSVRVEVTPTTATLIDRVALATIGAPLAIDATKGIALRIACDKGSGAWGTAVGRVRAWARVDGPYIGAVVNFGPRGDRLWEQIASSTTLAPGALSTTELAWGLEGAGGATYRYVLHSGGSSLETSGNIADSASGQPRGRAIPTAASPIHLAEGLRVHGLGGPAMAGDTWRHDVAYDHPVEAVDPGRHPSPKRRHRSTSDTVQHDITWTGLDLGWRTNDPLGILVVGANVGTMSLYRDSGGANLVAAMDLRIQGLGYNRSRGQITPAAGAAVPWQVSEGSLRGAHVDLGGGIVRKVRTSRAGAWQATGTAGTYASTRVELDAYDALDPASGTLDLWMPGGFFVTESMASTNTLMLRIPVQATTENYFELATILIGRFRVIERCSWGRSLQFSPNVALTTAPSGARTARVLGPMLQSEEIAWDDGIDTTGIHVSGSSPGWYTLGYTGADAIGSPTDTPRSLAGLLSDLGGSAVPVGYARAFRPVTSALSAAGPYRDLDPHSALYGRILTETLRVDTQLGDEQRNELVKVGRVRFEAER